MDHVEDPTKQHDKLMEQNIQISVCLDQELAPSTTTHYVLMMLIICSRRLLFVKVGICLRELRNREKCADSCQCLSC